MLKIDQLVIANKSQLSYACFMPHDNEFLSLLIQTMPVYHENGEVIALLSLATEFNFFGLNDHFNTLQGKVAGAANNDA